MPSTSSLLNFIIPPALEGWAVPLALPAPPGQGVDATAVEAWREAHPQGDGTLAPALFWVAAARALEGPRALLALPAPPAPVPAERPQVTPPPVTNLPGLAQYALPTAEAATQPHSGSDVPAAPAYPPDLPGHPGEGAAYPPHLPGIFGEGEGGPSRSADTSRGGERAIASPVASLLPVSLPLPGVPAEVTQHPVPGIPLGSPRVSPGVNVRAAPDAVMGPAGELGWVLVRRNAARPRPQQEAGNSPVRMPPAPRSAGIVLPDTAGFDAANAPQTLPPPATTLGTAAAPPQGTQELSPESSTEHIMPATRPLVNPHMPSFAPGHPGSRPPFPSPEHPSPVLHLVPFVPRLAAIGNDIQSAESIQGAASEHGDELVAMSGTPQANMEGACTLPSQQHEHAHELVVVSGTVRSFTDDACASWTQERGNRKISGHACRLAHLVVGLAPVLISLLVEFGVTGFAGPRAAAPGRGAVTWRPPAAWEVALLAP